MSILNHTASCIDRDRMTVDDENELVLIDEAMMGDEWTDDDDLAEFAQHLEFIVERRVCTADSHNGGDASTVSERDWNAALDSYASGHVGDPGPWILEDRS